MIHDDDGARRLARSILADLRLYQSAESVGHAGAIAEGRTLFCERVAPSLHGVWDQELGASGMPGAGAHATGPGVSPSPSGVEVVDGTGMLRVALPIALALVIFAVGAFFALMR